MIEVGRRGDFSIGILGPEDATRELALDIMRTQGNAYVHRFPDLPPQDILDAQEADYRTPNEGHVLATIDNITKVSEEDHWHWGVAMLGKRAVSFALFIAEDDGPITDGIDEINLAELHTHPEVQQQGLASIVALAALRRVRQLEQCDDSTPTTLLVARQHPEDENEHPYALYRRLTFKPAGRDGSYNFGKHSVPAWRMDTTLGALDAALSRRVDIDLRVLTS